MRVWNVLIVACLSLVGSTVLGQGNVSGLYVGGGASALARGDEPQKNSQQSNSKPEMTWAEYYKLNPNWSYADKETGKCVDAYRVHYVPVWAEYKKCITNAENDSKRIDNCETIFAQKMNPYRKQCDECQKAIRSQPKIPSKGLVNNNPDFYNTPEQQRQQAAFQRQQLNQQTDLLMNNMMGNMAEGGRQTANEFAQKTAGNQEKVNAINNQSNQNQHKDEKGIMDVARRGNLSTEDLGPGQEVDDTNELIVTDRKPTLLTGNEQPKLNPQRKDNNNWNPYFDQVKEYGKEAFLDVVPNNLKNGVEFYDKFNSINNKLSIGIDLVNGRITPDKLKSLFPSSENSIVKKFQDVAKNGVTGFFDKTGTLAGNLDPEGVSEADLDNFEQSVNPSNRFPTFDKNLSSRPLTRNELAGMIAGGAILGVISAPLWAPIALGGYFAFRTTNPIKP